MECSCGPCGISCPGACGCVTAQNGSCFAICLDDFGVDDGTVGNGRNSIKTLRAEEKLDICIKGATLQQLKGFIRNLESKHY